MKTKPNRKVPLPVIVTGKDLLANPLPKGPFAIQFTAEEWKKLKKSLPRSAAKPRHGAKGFLVREDPYGNHNAWAVCILRGRYCFPIVERGPGGTIIFKGCRCHDGVTEEEDLPRPHEPQPCGIIINRKGRMSCAGACPQSAGISTQCRPVLMRGLFGEELIGCECRR